MRIGFALGQELFTPAQISTPNFMIRDRLYGAWLHGSLILRRAGQMGDFSVMDEFELDLGVVGPEALGWHEVTDYNLPIEYVVSPMESFSTHPSYNPALVHLRVCWRGWPRRWP